MNNICGNFGDKPCSTIGAEADDDKIELLLSQVKGKDITELLAAGREKLASVPSGGGAAVAVAVAGGADTAAVAAAPAAVESKKEEKEESEEEDGGLFGLFD
ncbi:hypothetical protein ACB098_09G050100 [Castanea mollissima]